jgi:hypothetical protein
MGLMQAAMTGFAKMSAGRDVESQVNSIYDEILAEVKASEEGQKIPSGQEYFLVLNAASQAESQLLGNIDLLLEQLHADKQRAMPNEVGTKILNRIRDIKVNALEADGFVNPLDWASIQMQAAGLKADARGMLTSIRMRKRDIDPMTALDLVEMQLIERASKKHDCDYHKWQREAQAAILAVAELRLQQFLAVVRG